MDPQMLVDRMDIIAVCTRTHWLVDHRAWGELHSVLDGEVSFPTLAEQERDDFAADNYVRPLDEIVAAYPALLGGLTTMHLLAGHHVEIDGDKAVCRAHSINVHVADAAVDSDVVSHGNEYQFALRRTPAGWRVVARQTWARWSRGPTAMHDVAAKQLRWAEFVRPRSCEEDGYLSS